MKLLIRFLCAAILCAACSQENKTDSAVRMAHPEGSKPENQVDKGSTSETSTIAVDKIHVGMSIEDMKGQYKNARFDPEPVYFYGIDGEGAGIVVTRNGERLFFVWTREGEDTIRGIVILSPLIQVDQGVHVGMTLEKFLAKYPEHLYPENKVAISMIDLELEFSYVKGKDYQVQFLTTDSTRVAEYNDNAPEPEFIRVRSPQAVIDRIYVH